MTQSSRIRLALVGSGIFAQDAHLPALKTLEDRFEITAVYSRSRENAEALARDIPGGPAIYTDLDAVLTSDAVDAVDLLLPIEGLPSAIETALKAGKHVVSEKPIAPDVATGRRLLSEYQQRQRQVWMVAENWRYESAFVKAAEVVSSGAIGKPVIAHWAQHSGLQPGNKYYGTPWRRSGTFQGGFLLDGGVHQIAAWRLILGEIVGVTAFVRQVRPDLPPADTLTAALEFESGLIGTYTSTYAAAAPWTNWLHVVGEKGALRIDRGRLEVTTPDGTQVEDFPESTGVRDELLAFADAIQHGTLHRNSPQQGLQDVAVVESMLRASETGCRVAVNRFA